MDKHKRTIAKTISFRVLATITTMILVYIFTKDLAITGSIGLLETVSKLVLYYGHERAWEKIHWGKKF